jgi:hypothetical protein
MSVTPIFIQLQSPSNSKQGKQNKASFMGQPHNQASLEYHALLTCGFVCLPKQMNKLRISMF